MARIAIAVRNLPGGTGASRTVLFRARSLVEAGHRVDLYARTANTELVKATGANFVKVKSLFDRSREHFAKQAGKRMTQGGYDVIFGHGDVREQDVLTLHNLSLRYREAVMGKTGPPERDYAILHDETLRADRFRLVSANSELMKRDLVSRYGIAPEKIAVTYPGCDVEAFSPQKAAPLRAEARAELGVAEDTVLVGLVTSGDLHKRGADVFVQTLAGLPADLRERSAFLLVGKPSKTQEYLHMAQTAGVAGHLLTAAPTQAVSRFYAALDVFFLPARLEEYGQVVAEAMACGLAVVTTRQVGATEWLDERSAPYLSEMPDAQAHARQIGQLIDDPSKRANLGARNRQLILPNTLQHHLETLLSAMERVGLPALR